MPSEDDYAYALEEGRRGIDQQRDELKAIRDRAMALLTASGIIVAIVGGLAGRDKTLLPGGLALASGGAFVGIVGIAIAILWPREFKFWQDPRQIISWTEHAKLARDQVARSIAYYHGTNYVENGKVLLRMTKAYRVAILFLAIEVITLMLELGG